LKLGGFEAGLIFNFNSTSLRSGLKRVDHPDVYEQRRAARLGRNASTSQGKTS